MPSFFQKKKKKLSRWVHFSFFFFFPPLALVTLCRSNSQSEFPTDRSWPSFLLFASPRIGDGYRVRKSHFFFLNSIRASVERKEETRGEGSWSKDRGVPRSIRARLDEGWNGGRISKETSLSGDDRLRRIRCFNLNDAVNIIRERGERKRSLVLSCN